MERYIVGITGASGSAYALALIDALLARGAQVHAVLTEMGEQVLRYECGLRFDEWARGRENLQTEDNRDLFSPIASGSFPVAGMAVAPCSVSTLGRIAAGVADDLLARAADVSLAQRRPLVLMVRETPLSAVHLQNMLALCQAGALILPACPGFYHRPQTLGELTGFMAGKVLDCLGLDNECYPHWKGGRK